MGGGLNLPIGQKVAEALQHSEIKVDVLRRNEHLDGLGRVHNSEDGREKKMMEVKNGPRR